MVGRNGDFIISNPTEVLLYGVKETALVSDALKKADALSTDAENLVAEAGYELDQETNPVAAEHRRQQLLQAAWLSIYSSTVDKLCAPEISERWARLARR
ncbi:MAG: hypothetical protein JWM81_120 [Candidatus Saccharibacteria bacterium]|nr:hypothetical protein [Candidatus Saccharibacteria bacterium]